MISKKELDKILILYKVQTVGNGYTDIIVRRENVQQLVEFLILNGIRIYRITWWEYVDNKSKPGKFGMGGPISRYDEGWFSELCFGDDEISKNTVKEIMKIIENKEITFFDGERIIYRRDEFLTPALCLDVPSEW